MGKVFNSIIMSVVVGLAVALFDSSAFSLTTMFQLFFNPGSISGSQLFKSFWSTTFLLTTGGAALAFIGTFVFKSDWITRSGIFTVILGWVEAPFLSLWNFIAPKISSLTGSECSGTICSQFGINPLGALIAGIIVSPMIFYSIWSIEEWVWGGDR